MSDPQNTIAIVYDYDQTLSPSYMQDEVMFPAFGINSQIFWRRCSELVRDHGYENELAYMKVLLDQIGMDRPTNEELKKLGAKLNFYQGLPEMFEEFRGGEGLLTAEHVAHGITVSDAVGVRGKLVTFLKTNALRIVGIVNRNRLSSVFLHHGQARHIGGPSPT